MQGNEFDYLWREVTNDAFMTVQDYEELKYVFSLMEQCTSYLEIGSAEGKSLYVLGCAMPEGSHIAYVDIDEEKTRQPRIDRIKLLTDIKKHKVTGISGDSHSPIVIERAKSLGKFDAVMIDAGHSTDDVMQDWSAYGSLATKYVFFHDIALSEVRDAWDVIRMNHRGKSWEFISHDSKFRYGILEV